MRNRINQHQQGRHIAAEAGRAELLTLDPGRTHQQDRQDPGCLQEAHHRILEGQQALGAETGLAMEVDFGFETGLQPGLGREGPHQGQAPNRLPQQGGQLAHLLLAAFGGAHHPGPEQTHQHGH